MYNSTFSILGSLTAIYAILISNDFEHNLIKTISVTINFTVYIYFTSCYTAPICWFVSYNSNNNNKSITVSKHITMVRYIIRIRTQNVTMHNSGNSHINEYIIILTKS